MDFDTVIEILLIVTGVVFGARGVYRMMRLGPNPAHPRWSRTTSRIVDVSARRSKLRAADEPLAARVAYSYITPAGPQEGSAELPLRRAVPLSGSLEIAVRPGNDARSAAVYPQPGRGRRFLSALAGFGLGVALVGYGGATLAGLLPFEAHDLSMGKLAFAALAGLGAAYTWVARQDTTPDGTTWIPATATVGEAVSGQSGWSSKWWYVYVTYDEPDGVRRSGAATRKGDRPEPGTQLRMQVDAADPGHFRFP